MGANQWRSAETWPLPETQWQRYFLRSHGQAQTASGDGFLSLEERVTNLRTSMCMTLDSRFRLTAGKIWRPEALSPDLLTQFHIENRSDVLCYTTPELGQDLEVTGPLALHIFASTSVKDTDFTAKLIDVFPNGAPYNVAEGCIRARYRRSVLKEELLKPGEIHEYVIDIGRNQHLIQTRPSHSD